MTVPGPVPLRRRVLVETLRGAGIRDERVLAAFAAVPREQFVPRAEHHRAYEDFALEIGEGQTISQPSVVARITELAAVTARDRVLEIGTGSGFQAAILAELARFVFTVERLRRLAEQARGRLQALGYGNVSVQVMDGSLGWKAQAPFDVIVVSAAAPSVPPILRDQLAEGGRLVAPVGDRDHQNLVRVVRTGDGFEEHAFQGVRFVPLVGRQGFTEAS